jgi:two-component system nitrogen regulation response regulator NtrX
MSKIGKILIVDDDSLILESLYEAFIDDYDVLTASSGQEGLDILEANPDIEAVVLDIKMAKMDGLETASRIQKINPDLPIIFCTGFPGDYSESQIDNEFKPFEYIVKNERPSKLHRAVRNAITQYNLKMGKSDITEIARKEYSMVGSSKVMQEVYQLIEQVAPTENKIMILGPTGTGKELVARAIHKRSCRSGERMAILNCNHKSPDLIESELFGHLKGSFTGATADRLGIIEYADQGTLFLDEIGDLDITTQAKLLRVLETGEMQKLGSSEIKKVNVRLICATNCDLKQMIKENKFREDLYYRLKGIVINLPALSDRRGDIPELVEYFNQSHCMQFGNGIKVFEPEAIGLLTEYDWPGNVRQLADTIRSLIDLTNSSFISSADVRKYLELDSKDLAESSSFNDRVNNYKRTVIRQALARHNNNVSAAARELSIDPSNLNKMIKSLDIN